MKTLQLQWWHLMIVVASFILGLATVGVVLSASADTWSITTNSAFTLAEFEAVTFDGQLCTMGGFTGAVRTPKVRCFDGTTWSEIGTDTMLPIRPSDYGLAIFDSEVYVTGGISGSGPNFVDEVFHSSDLASWSTETAVLPTPVGQHCSLAFDSKLWVIAGVPTDNAQSPITTVRAATDPTDAGDWNTIGNIPQARKDHACTVFNSQMWVIGGIDVTGNRTQSVYSTFDGATWEDHGDVLPAAKSSLGLQPYDNRLVAFSGTTTGVTGSQSVYTSVDGDNWITLGDSIVPGGRYAFGSGILNGRIYQIGGYDAVTPADDVYQTDSVAGNIPFPTQDQVNKDQVVSGATPDQSGDTPLADIPLLGQVFADAGTAWGDSGIEVVFWTMLAFVTTTATGLAVVKVSPGNLTLPAIAVVGTCAMWMVAGPGVIPFWLFLAAGALALGITSVGREVLN